MEDDYITLSSNNQSSHKFSCIHCGDNYELFPPESGLKYAYSNPCKEQGNNPNHNKQQTVICKSCHKSSQLYWCHGHIHVASYDSRRYENTYKEKESFFLI